jgi:two-component system, chemotaxis family, protein-glutamate methylesterase/glutaminase
MRGLRVLIVDDSLLFREILARELLKYLPQGSNIEKAANPFEARDKILEFDPDVMLLDIEMPKMNGVEFLRRLIVQYPLPTVILSGSPQYREQALAAGAVDFVEKPQGHLLHAGSDFFSGLVAKLCAAVVHYLHVQTPDGGDTVLQAGIIAIGASTGGTEALARVLRELRPPLPGIVVVQHIPPMFSRLFAQRLDAETQFKTVEASSGEIVKNNHVFIAPGDKHMRIKRVGRDFIIDCMPGKNVNGHCPSVDVMFRSVAVAARDKAIGVILTGMGGDGAKGLLAMRQAGARTLGQDEASCVVYGMPRVAWEIGAVGRQLSLDAIAGAITSLVIGKQVR